MLLTLDQAFSQLREAEYTRSAVITDPNQPDNPIVYATKAFFDLTGYRPDDVFGHNCRFLQGSGTDPEAIQHIHDAVEERRPIVIDILNYRKDGTPFWNRLRIRPSFNAEGALDGFVAVQNQIPEAEVRPFDIDLIEE